MSSPRIFDQQHYEVLNSARAAVVSRFLSEVKGPLNLQTAVDVGCGLGYFSRFLCSLGFEVTAVDGRAENVEEAGRRNPGLRVQTVNAEDPALKRLGAFDLVFCFGLLYHLENPFLVVHHLRSITRKLLLVEAVVYAGDGPLMALVDETASEDQGLSHVGFYPTEACLIKMFFRAGFSAVYRFAALPDYPGYRETGQFRKVRTMLVASHSPFDSGLLEAVTDRVGNDEPWNPSKKNTVRVQNALGKGFRKISRIIMGQ